MSLDHRVINTLEELEVISKNKNSVRITYTNVFSHLRSRDRKLRVFSKPELNITCLPGRYLIVTSYGCKRSSIRYSLGGADIKFFSWIASRGLWSDSAIKLRP